MNNKKNKSSIFYLSRKRKENINYLFSKGRFTNIFWKFIPKIKPFGCPIIKK